MNLMHKSPTPERYVLGITGKDFLRFTLVFNSATDFFVECHDDSPNTFAADRIRIIPISEFDKYDVNGVSLRKLVANKLHELSERRSMPIGA